MTLHPAFLEPTRPAPTLLRACGIVKRFGSLTANDVERFEVRTAEVHALLGENGAGKSTLSKILYGYYQPDAGEIALDGHPVRLRSPADARALGIGMVFQDFSLIGALSVFENIVLFMQRLPRVLRRRALEREIKETAAALAMNIELRVPAGALSAGEQQKVEIIKQVLAGARVLFLDEPTKVLAPQERRGLFKTLAALRARGCGIVLITHKLDEALQFADRISVMRKGRVVGVQDAADTSEAELLAQMFDGGIPAEPRQHRVSTPGGAAVELLGVSTRAEDHAVALDNVSLCVREGEVVGMAGIAGSGQREVAALIVGRTSPKSGNKRLWGVEALDWTVARVRDLAVAFIPENPLVLAGVAELTVLENFALGAHRYRLRLNTDWPRVRADAQSAYARLGFAPPALDAPLRTLSGGNVQRLVMARELARGPRLIVAVYPSRGLDARSAMAVRHTLRTLADQGAAVLLESEELDELFELCDRLVVMCEGRITGSFAQHEFAVDAVGAAMVSSLGSAHVH